MITKAFNPGSPSRTIMLRQLPLAMEDHELRSEFALMGITVKDVRLVKNRDTGQSRGFAFIEFYTVEEAQNWMNTTLVRIYKFKINQINILNNILKGLGCIFKLSK